MKKIFLITLIALLGVNIFAQEKTPETKELNPVTGFPEIQETPFITFHEGIAFSQINRIEYQTERSNFVHEDYLIGAYAAMQTHNMQPLNSLIKISAYYPFYHTFNGMMQVSKQMFLYGLDLFAGPIYQTDMWKYVRLTFALGLHYTYQLTDEYHMHYFGGGALAGAELPLARHWTIFADGLATLDYPNFGTNNKIQPYDISWQYHLDFGVRYSKKYQNKYSYINSRKK